MPEKTYQIDKGGAHFRDGSATEAILFLAVLAMRVNRKGAGRGRFP
jgi:hypothetical protein